VRELSGCRRGANAEREKEEGGKEKKGTRANRILLLILRTGKGERGKETPTAWAPGQKHAPMEKKRKGPSLHSLSLLPEEEEEKGEKRGETPSSDH